MRNEPVNLGFVVLGLFIGMVDDMDGGMICVSTWKYDSKSESKGSHISILVDSWEYTGNESSVWGGKNEMFTIFKEDLSIYAKKKGGDAEAHEIK